MWIHLHSGLSRSRLIRRLALIVAAAFRDSGGVAAIVLLGRTDRMHLTGDYRHANRADDDRDEDDGRQR